MNICTLKREFNKCIHFEVVDENTGICRCENPCSMAREIKENIGDENVRKERWYDKYYKK